ncbi:MAG: DMT family transporter [Propionivibrio sp.]
MSRQALNPHPFFSERKSVMLLATLCCLLWGSSYPAIKSGFALFAIAPGDMAGKFVFAGWRCLLAGAVLLGAAVVAQKDVFGLSAKNWREVAALGLLQTSVMFVFFYLGLAYTTGVKSSVLNGTVSFFGVLLAHFIYRNDRLTWAKSLGCLIGFAGVLVVNFNHDLLDFSFTAIGEGSVVLSAFFMAAGMVYGKHVSRQMDSSLMTGWQFDHRRHGAAGDRLRIGRGDGAAHRQVGAGPRLSRAQLLDRLYAVERAAQIQSGRHGQRVQLPGADLRRHPLRALSRGDLSRMEEPGRAGARVLRHLAGDPGKIDYRFDP